MLEKIKEKWEEILLHIKEEHELSDVSFKTWLLPTEESSAALILLPENKSRRRRQKFLIISFSPGLPTWISR